MYTNEKSENLFNRQERGDFGGFGVFCLLCCDGGERCNFSLALSLFFRKEYVCARVRILSEKKGEDD